MALAPKPEKRRVRPRRAETAERLLDGAFDLFAEKGFEASTIEDICARVHMTRGAFYSSFKTKDELFQALFSLQMTRLTDRLQRLWQGIDQLPDPMAAAMERYIATELSDRRWHRLLAEHRLMITRSPAGIEQSEALARNFSRALGDTIAWLVTIVGRKLDVPKEEASAACAAIADAANWRAAVDPEGAANFVRAFLPRLLLSCSSPLAGDAKG